MIEKNYNKQCTVGLLTAQIVVAGLSFNDRFFGVTNYGNTTIVFVVDDFTSQEEQTLDSVVDAHVFDDSHRESKILTFGSNNVLEKETGYSIDNGNGSYSVKTSEITYSYSGQKLLSSTLKIYGFDGSELFSETTTYYKNENRIIEKIEG